jgi:hypothetical protein
MIEEKTLSVPQAGRRYYDLGKNASYEAAKRGEIPTIKIGARLRVPVIAMERILQAVAIPELATADGSPFIPDRLTENVAEGNRHAPARRLPTSDVSHRGQRDRCSKNSGKSAERDAASAKQS